MDPEKDRTQRDNIDSTTYPIDLTQVAESKMLKKNVVELFYRLIDPSQLVSIFAKNQLVYYTTIAKANKQKISFQQCVTATFFT